MCEDCYIFSAIANIEGQYAIKHNQCLSFSEQQVMDCMPGADCGDGGDELEVVLEVMKFLAKSGYPCEKESERIALQTKAMVQTAYLLNITDEDALKQALVQMGPLSVAIAADGLIEYKDGIWAATKCDDIINHAVLLVGFGTDHETNTPFWIIKNSWGVHFGEHGYFRLERGKKACGIISYVSHAQVA